MVMTYSHAQDQRSVAIPKTEWKQTDQQTERRTEAIAFTSLANAVGKYAQYQTMLYEENEHSANSSAL